jgi:hypothetical protein
MKIHQGLLAVLVGTTMLLVVSVSVLAKDLWGGPTYTGAPELALTASLVQAGGGAGQFSVVKALDSMVGARLVDVEVAKLTKQYGKATVGIWVKAFNAAVEDALQVAAKRGVKLPQATLTGKPLAVALVKTGTTPDGTFWAGWLYDNLLTHAIHDQVMTDLEQNPAYGVNDDATLHAINNQAFYDLAHALGDTSVKLASFHTPIQPTN